MFLSLTLHVKRGEGGEGALHELVDGTTLNPPAGVRLGHVEGHHAHRVHELLLGPWVAGERQKKHIIQNKVNMGGWRTVEKT